MSFYVVVSVLKHSQSKLAQRLVMIALADAAGRDGVTWIGQKHIAETAKVSQAHVRECLAALEEAGEIEARKAQIGRRRINVYRLRVQGVEPVDYDRLPFVLNEPFSDDRGISAPVDSADDRGISGATTAGSPQLDNGATRGGEEALEPVREPVSEASPPPAKQGHPNLPFDALVEVCPGTEASVDGRMVAKALKEIRDRLMPEFDGAIQGVPPAIRDRIFGAIDGDRCSVCGELNDKDHRDNGGHDDRRDPRDNRALADEIRLRAQVYRERWPDAELTPTALAKHWTRIVIPKAGGKVTAAEMFAGVDPGEL